MKRLIYLIPLLLLLSGCSNWKGQTNVECTRFLSVDLRSGTVIEESDNFVMVSGEYKQYKDNYSYGLEVIYSGNGIISFEKSECNRGGQYLKDELTMLEQEYKEKKYTKGDCKSMFMDDGIETNLNGTIKVLYYPKTYFLTKQQGILND